MSKKQKEIHGNNAKVDSGSKIEPLFITNTVTMSGERDNEVPIVPDANVSYARKFQEENKK